MKMICMCLTALMTLFMVGCTGVETRPVPNQTAQIVGIDPSLTIRCATLPMIQTTVIPMGGLLVLASSLQQMYNNCAIRNDKLIDAVNSLVEKVNKHANSKK